MLINVIGAAFRYRVCLDITYLGTSLTKEAHMRAPARAMVDLAEILECYMLHAFNIVQTCILV